MGTPEEIYNEPENAFVADFIGDSNIVPGIMMEDRVVTVSYTHLDVYKRQPLGTNISHEKIKSNKKLTNTSYIAGILLYKKRKAGKENEFRFFDKLCSASSVWNLHMCRIHFQGHKEVSKRFNCATASDNRRYS